MSRILELARTFEEQSKNEAKTITENVNNAIKAHEEDLIKQLRDASKNIEDVIHLERKKLITATIRLWRLPSIIVMIILTMALISAMWLMWKAKQAYEIKNEMEISAHHYQKISQQMIIKTCQIKDQPSQYCVEIDPRYKGTYWGTKGDLVILPIKVEEK